MMKKENLTYLEALAEIEEIVGRLGQQPCDVDALSAQVARAEKLIAICRERILMAGEYTKEI
jgi:exodeoxyribonuclease VII small subunit